MQAGIRRSLRLGAAFAMLMLPQSLPALADSSPSGFMPGPAEISPSATRTMILDATRAGPRLVTVGDRGVILLSDDAGASWRQAKRVPTEATLTAVSFVDARMGWVAGHWGTILKTEDGGETWTVQRFDTSEDRPLFAVHFLDAEHGVVAGLWSLVLRTEDGGRTWQEVSPPPPPGESRADANLMHIFANRGGDLYITGERGTLMRSSDKGRSWSHHPTGYRGSFWTGTALDDGTLILAGMRGSIYRSVDDGSNWTVVGGATRSSITDVVPLGDRLVAVALDGVTLESDDHGLSFVAQQRPDRLSLTAVVALDANRTLVFSRAGVLSDQAAKP